MALAGVALLLFLLLVANGTPVLLKRFLGDRGARPIDGGRRFRDGRPLLGRSKTWRGLVGAIVATSIVAWAIGSGAWLGALVAVTAHLGDMASSFSKRRLGIASSGQALGIDQIPESLLPALAAAWPLGLGVVEIALVVVLFFVGELALSRLLFRLRIRDEPY
jgi:CDP-2,3-bis-(O-geranylgeranyl)-sn-glycerol synthase